MIQISGKLYLLVASALAGLLVCGCVDNNPQRQAVSGTVTLDGKPVDRATIIFTPVGDGLSAAAVIVDGKFSLSEEDGPTVGQFDVRVNPMDAELDQVEADPSVLADANRKPSVPKVYQTHGKLKATITNQPDQVLEYPLATK